MLHGLLFLTDFQWPFCNTVASRARATTLDKKFGNLLLMAHSWKGERNELFVGTLLVAGGSKVILLIVFIFSRSPIDTDSGITFVYLIARGYLSKLLFIGYMHIIIVHCNVNC